MATEPLTPQQVERLLRPDLRTTAADLLQLRDSLLRMREAFARLASTAARLERSARLLQGAAGRRRTAVDGLAAPRETRG
jgi:hypothetical protein